MPLVAYYPLDENSGSTANDVAGSNDGTINGATVGATGILGTTCYSFDGTDDDVSTAASTVGFSALSVTAWINSDGWDGSGQDIIVSQEQSGDTDILSIGNRSGSFEFDLDPGGNPGPLSTSNPATGQWVFIACTWDGSTRFIYYDAVEQTSGSVSGTLVSTTGDVYIGGSDKDLGYFDGLIDDVRIYDHALTPAEVQYLYNASQRGDYLSSIKTQ